MDSLDSNLLSYIKSQHTLPLSPSKSLNIPKYDIKSLESLCINSLNELLSNIKIQYIQSIHIKLQFLYTIYSKNYPFWLGVLKKHQLFIVRLFELKQFDAILDQLINSYEQISQKLDIHHKPVDKLVLINGIPIKSCDEELSQIIIAFHFYTLQWLVQTLLKQNTDSDTNIIKRVPLLFLTTSNIRQWISRSQTNQQKYTNNCIKLINGFIKVINKISIDSELEVICLKIKLLEITGNNEGIENLNVVPGIEEFIMDSKSVENIDILSQKLHDLNSYPMKRKGRRLSDEFAMIFNRQSINDKEFLIRLSEIKLNETSITGILNFFLTSAHLLKQLSTIHLTILDSITKFCQKSLGKSLVPSLVLLHDIFSYFKLERKMRNTVTLLFQLGKKLNDNRILNLSIEKECEIISQWPTDDNLDKLILKLNSIKYLDSKIFSNILQACPATKKVINCTFKICLRQPEIVTSFNSIESNLRISYILGLFNLKDSNINMPQKSTLFSSIIYNVNYENDIRVIFAYYNANNIEHSTDIDIPQYNNLVIFGFQMFKMLASSHWDKDVLKNCYYSLQSWDYEHNELELTIAKQIILFLKYNGMTSELYHLITNLRANNFDDEFKTFLEFQMCDIAAKLSLNEAWNLSLDNIHLLMKNAKSLTVQMVLNYKLQRICLMYENGQFNLAKSKFKELISVVKSREEFDMTTSKSLPLVDKMKNYIILAQLQIIVSKLNSNDLVLSFSNIKSAIQSLQSIIHNCSKILKETDANEILWESCNLLFDAFSLAIERLIDLGSSRNIIAFLKEWNKLNENHNIPTVNQVNNYKIQIYEKLINSNILSSSLNLVENDQVCTNKTIQYLKSIAESLEVENFFVLPQFNPEDTFESHFEIKNYRFIHFIHNSVDQELFSLEDSYNECIEELNNYKLNIVFPNSSQLFPSITCGDIILDQKTMNIFMKLGKIKDHLLKLSQNLNLSIIQHRKYYYLLSRTLHLISSISAYKGKDLINQLFFIQDLIKSISFKNNKDLALIGKIDYIPELTNKQAKPYVQEFTNFKNQLNLIPSNWEIITLDICDQTGDLILSKFNKVPVFVRLSLSRFKERESIDTLSFDELKTKFKEIFAQNRKSTQFSTTSLVKTVEDRKNWWKSRFALDYELQDLCEHIENYWFGGFKSIFSTKSDDKHYQNFKDELIQILKSNISNETEKSIKWNEFIYECFFGLEKYDRSCIDDLLNYMTQLLQFHLNNKKMVNLSNIHDSLERLYLRYPKSKLYQNSHIILIPSTRCAFFPWESLEFLKNKSISRMPSVSSLLETLKNPMKIQSSNAYYLVNPGGDLQSSENRFRTYMEQQKTWTGIIGTKPQENKIISNILSSNLFIYIGHGGCDQYVKLSDLIKATQIKNLPPSFLIGCSSGEIQDNGKFEPSGLILNWLNCGSSAILANLWDVTDKDIDTFTISMFEKWGLFPSDNNKFVDIAESIRKSRDVCVLKYLNGAAPVIYGLPISISH
ncbi:ESP1 [Candida jiufengensis]|uniref:ESP1 n=1 Tax=Candida jiufengensis TaxID=497108 RepID=UPI00222462D4|nr:ESP1 [Candida jiufengensis]KAI5955753.1 ESP1 [Candida jiufengensis]